MLCHVMYHSITVYIYIYTYIYIYIYENIYTYIHMYLYANLFLLKSVKDGSQYHKVNNYRGVYCGISEERSQ